MNKVEAFSFETVLLGNQEHAFVFVGSFVLVEDTAEDFPDARRLGLTDGGYSKMLGFALSALVLGRD